MTPLQHIGDRIPCPGENARLLRYAEIMLGARWLSGKDLAFVMTVRSQHMRRPDMRLTGKQARWLSEIVARFQAEMLGPDGDPMEDA